MYKLWTFLDTITNKDTVVNHYSGPSFIQIHLNSFKFIHHSHHSHQSEIISQALLGTSTTTGLSTSQNPDHRRSNLLASDPDGLLKTPNNRGRKRWKCFHCSAQFRTKKLKSKHEEERHPNVSLNEPPSILIDDDSDNDFPLPTITEVNVGVDQNDTKFAEEPEIDLGLYLMEKHSQIGNFDPLEVNNSSDSLLTYKTVGGHLKVQNPDDINNKWKCRICSERFRTRDLLREHNHLHMGMKRPKQTIKVENLKKVDKVSVKMVPKEIIEVAKHSSPKSRWQCQSCSLVFETRELMRIHRRTHAVEKEPKEVYVPKAVTEPAQSMKVLKVYQGPKKRKMEQSTDE